MIDRHWDGIAAYCRPENKVALGFVEGLNNKIRVLERRAYGLRDEEYLRLKILTACYGHSGRVRHTPMCLKSPTRIPEDPVFWERGCAASCWRALMRPSSTLR